MAETLTSADEQILLDGVDSAFEAVLHGRYGGGISATLAQASGEATPATLRAARAGSLAFIRLHLQPRSVQAGAGVDGMPIGTAQLSDGPKSAVAGTTVQTEIFLDADPNEPSDGTALSSGVLLQSAPASLPNGGLLVVRSTEAARNHEQMALAEQQNWRPNPSRHIAASGLGASGRGHRQASPVAMRLPVSADLLARLGAAAASLTVEIGQVSVVLLPNGPA